MSLDLETPPQKNKKRVRQLITLYEKILTPTGTPTAASLAPETPSNDASDRPSKRRKLIDESIPLPPPLELEKVEKMEVEVPVESLLPDLASEDLTAQQKRQSRSARKSRRINKETKYSKRVFCAKEILSTERTYVEMLQGLHKNWMIPLSKVASENDIHRMFGNIVSIMKFNETLLERLEKRMKSFDPETTLIGDIFVSLVPFLSMYTDYCCNYREGIQLIVSRKQEDSEFANVLAQSLIVSKGMDVHDYCITPVQRVPRYRLLLENLLKQTPPEHPDYSNLVVALQLVSDKAADINKKMNLVDQQKKMTELHHRFSSPPLGNEDLVQPWRYLVSEFNVQVVATGAAFPDLDATLYLFNDIFILAHLEDPEDSESKLLLITAQPLWNCYLKKLEPGWTLAQRAVPPFQVVNPNGVWNLIIENKAKFKADFEQLRDASLANSAEKKQKRSLIKLFPNKETQEWMAVEPAPNYASNRVSTQILAAETTEFTKMALEELLSENREIFESRSVTPAKTPKKSRLGKLKDAMTPLKWSSKKANPTQSVLSPKDCDTPSRSSVSFTSLTFDHLQSPVSATPTRPVSMMLMSDKENGASDSVNQADVIRSTIAKLSQSSANLVKPIAGSQSTPALSSSKKPSSPALSPVTPDIRKTGRRHKRANTIDKTSSPHPHPITSSNHW